MKFFTFKLTRLFSKSFLLTLLILYIAISIFIYINQDALLYNPKPKAPNNLKERVFENEGESIHVTLVNEGQKKAIIYFGGNAEDVEYNYLPFAINFTKHTSYLVQYRGFLNSTGRASQKALFSDALKIYEKIKDNYEEIVVIGRSLGSGVATYLASKTDIKKLILVTPYDSIENIAIERFVIFPISLMLKDKYDSASRVKDINAQTLIIYVKDDIAVSNKRTKELIKKFPKQQLKVKVLEHETHSSILDSPEYLTYIKKFIY